MKLGLVLPVGDADYDGQVNRIKDHLPAETLFIPTTMLTLDLLERERPAVVVAANLPKQWCYLLRGLGIVTIVFGERDYYYDLVDIVVDYKCIEGSHYFTGPNVDFTRESAASFVEVAELVKSLEWDTKFFGVNVAYVSCLHLSDNIYKAISHYVAAHNIQLIEYLCNCHDRRSVLIAEKEGFTFVDIRLTFARKLAGFAASASSDSWTFRKANEADIPELEMMASEIYTKSRYFFDEKFGTSKAQEFYKSWIRKAVTGDFDDECWCLADGTDIGAFCSIKYTEESAAQIGLIGVQKAYAGRGLGRRMVESVMTMLADKGIADLAVVTQGRNYSAQNLYQSVGFRTRETQLWYHKWR